MCPDSSPTPISSAGHPGLPPDRDPLGVVRKGHHVRQARHGIVRSNGRGRQRLGESSHGRHPRGVMDVADRIGSCRRTPRSWRRCSPASVRPRSIRSASSITRRTRIARSAEMRALAAPVARLKLMVYHRRSWKVFWILTTHERGRFWKAERAHREARRGTNRMSRRLHATHAARRANSSTGPASVSRELTRRSRLPLSHPRLRRVPLRQGAVLPLDAGTPLPRLRARVRLAPPDHGRGRLATCAVAVVGLGKLGAPLAAVLASKGNDVIGIDINPDVVRLVHDGRAPVEEPGLQDLVSASAERLTATTDLDVAAERRSDDPARPDPVRRAWRVLERVSPRCHRKGRAGLVETRRVPRRRRREHRDARIVRARVRPALERASGSTGRRVARALLQPRVHRPRQRHPRHARARHGADRRVRLSSRRCCSSGSTPACVENDPPFRRMSLVNAELTKIAVNTYVTMKISYANTLADMCERLPGRRRRNRDGRARARHANRREVPPWRDRLRQAPASRATTRRSPCWPATSAPRRRSPRRPTRSTIAQTRRLARIVLSRLGGRRRRRDPRSHVQARHRCGRGESRTSRSPVLLGQAAGRERQRVRPRRDRRRRGVVLGRRRACVQLRARAARAIRRRGDRDAVEEFPDLPVESLGRHESVTGRDRLLAAPLRRAHGDVVEIVRLGRAVEGKPRA